jgi:hypothetical protein
VSDFPVPGEATLVSAAARVLAVTTLPPVRIGHTGGPAGRAPSAGPAAR